ncbi:MAG: DUF1559 domain-containing protein [Gemmataceae bacterium]|nr:DUF1559 domain-containing protein [Gemmataceae bacterium]
MTAPTLAAPPARRRLTAALTVTLTLLIAVLLWTSTFGAGDRPGKKVALTPELAWVPPEAALFVHLRAAELWNAPIVKELRRHKIGDLFHLHTDLDRKLGVPVDGVEKVVLVFNSLDAVFGRSDKGAIKGKFDEKDVGWRGPDLWIVTVSDRATLTRLRNEVMQHGQEQRHKGKTYYINERRPGEAVHFVNDRTFVRGRVAAVKAGLERPARTEEGGPLAPALAKAQDKHHLVLGLQLTGDAAHQVVSLLEVGGEGVRRAVAPLLALKSGVLWLDVGKESRATLELQFPDEAHARRGLGAAQDFLTLLRVHDLGNRLVSREQDTDDAPDPGTAGKRAFDMLVLGRLMEALRGVRADQQGAMVRLSFTANTDADALAAEVKAFVKAHWDDEKARLVRFKRISAQNLKNLLLAIHSTHDVYKRLPPPAILDKQTGKPLLSWRVAILPFIEQAHLFRLFNLDEPWDGPNNKKLLERMPSLYAPVGVKTKAPYATFYRVFVAAPGSGVTAWQSQPDKESRFGAWGVRLNAIEDGTSITIGIVEAAESVPWTKPDELVYDDKKPLPKLGGLFRDGFHAAMMDGSVLFISRRADERQIRLAITAADGLPVDLEGLTRP